MSGAGATFGWSDHEGQWTLSGLDRAHDAASGDGAAVPAHEASRRLANAARDPLVWPSLVRLYEQFVGSRSTYPITVSDIEEDVIPLLCGALERGVVVASLIPWGSPRAGKKRHEEEAFARDSAGVAPPTESSPKVLRRVDEKTFIDVQVVDGRGKGLSGRAYQLQMPNGLVVKGSLSSDGHIYAGNLDPGTAKLTLPPPKGEVVDGAADGSASDLEGPLKPSEIGFRVADAQGRPVAGQPLRLKMKDGSIRDLVTDAQGTLKLDQLEEGQCELTIPGLAGGLWKLS